METQLQVFVAVAEEQNFTRAAEKLHISQPAISQHIQALEQRLGTRLLDRTNKYVRLNQAGEVVYHHAKDILNRCHQMEQLVNDLMEDASGSLRIGASLTFGEYVLPHLVGEFRGLHPKVEPTITIGNTHTIVEEVANGHLDIGVVEGREMDDTNVVVEPFAEDTVVVIAASHHPLARFAGGAEAGPAARAGKSGRGAESAGSLPSLSDETWIVRELGSGTREIADEVFRQFDIQPRMLIEYGSTQVIKESVEAGLGLAVLSKWAIRKELLCDTLRILPISDHPITRQFSIVLRKSDFQTKAVQTFREFLLGKSETLSQRM